MRALDGFRVVDLSTGIAGPVAGMFLADHGADVIKVEPVAGDPGRALPGFAMWNRGKRSVVADPETADGRGRILELLAGADACVVSTDTGHLHADLAPEAVARTHPRLVYLHTPPYGHRTPWAGGAESHGLLAAATGVALRQTSAHDGPIELVYPHLLYAQGAWAAACALAALLERDGWAPSAAGSGRGQVVTVAGVHGALITSTASATIDPALPPRDTATGPGGANPCYTRYRCGDGGWLFLGSLVPKFIDRAFGVLGVADLLDDPRIGGDHDRVYEPGNRDWVRARIAAAFATRPRDHWLRLLADADCPAGPLGDRDDWLDHPQITENGLRLELDDPERGRVVMPANPVALTDTPGSVRGPAPVLGHDQGEVSPAGARTAEPERRTAGAGAGAGPLAGLRVLGLGTFIAGAYPAMLLAELGADVVKVEPPAGDPFRVNGFTYNRGTRSVALDLRDPRGHAAFGALLDRADVVIDNYRAGVLDRLGIGYDALAARRPEIVAMSVTAYGDHGPYAKDPGFDPILQARSGMMTAQGGAGEPVFHTIPVDDVAAGVFAVFGVCAALLARRRTGRGQRVTTSLAAAAAFMQCGELVRYPGRPPAPRGGADHLGAGPLDRFHRAKDGWLRVHAALADLPAAAGLAAMVAALPAAEAAARLGDAGIPAVVARTFEELAADPEARDAEVVHRHGAYVTAGRFAWFGRTAMTGRLTPPGVGEHTEEVLGGAGVDAAALIAEGVAVAGPPMRPRIRDYR
ncbi:MAG TPA: CoA transferase [Streptosporangiaceae bacterium]|jgi:crotonobetainyl-CoA:carnitine CoA-transferase CaiB-like acyl-CoA transferase